MSGAINQVTNQINVTLGQQAVEKKEEAKQDKAQVKMQTDYDNLQIDRETVEISKENPLKTDKDGGRDLKNMRSEETEENKLKDLIKDSIEHDQFMDNNEYVLLCNNIMQGNLADFNKLEKNKKIEFLIKLYKDPDPQSERVLDTILPFVGVALISISFNFCATNFINTNKKIALLKRLAPEQNLKADESIIRLLLNSDENVISGCPLDTLLSLRQKEHLGNSYYNQLLKNNNGKLSKADFKKLSFLSVKITTICYAYYADATNNLINKVLSKNIMLSKEALSQLKGLSRDQINDILNKLRDSGLVLPNYKITQGLSYDEMKKNIKDIIMETTGLKNAVKAELANS
ncbi:MAG: hypothetical protein PHV30_05915 [Candidatus Margulisbacteria bacterium]|nr:hypothetical protein [Candidatus Margulisiibacteriota bacterium]